MLHLQNMSNLSIIGDKRIFRLKKKFLTKHKTRPLGDIPYDVDWWTINRVKKKIVLLVLNDLKIILNEIINNDSRYLRYILCRNYIYYLPVNKENDKLAVSSLLIKSQN